jgi:hypothetical protein
VRHQFYEQRCGLLWKMGDIPAAAVILSNLQCWCVAGGADVGGEHGMCRGFLVSPWSLSIGAPFAPNSQAHFVNRMLNKIVASSAGRKFLS